MKYNILLVEDDENLGFMLQDNLRMADYQVRLCRDGDKGLTAFHNEDFHLCVFDVMLPNRDGFTLAEDIRKYNKKVPIIFLTAKNQKEHRIQGFKLGGDDYITKPFSLEEFLLRIEAVLKRVYDRPSTSDSNASFHIGIYKFDAQNRRLTSQSNEHRLTNKESKLLKLLAQNINQIAERDVIMKVIWEDEGYFAARSLDVFISKLRKYFKEDPGVSIDNIHGIGYRLSSKVNQSL